MADFYLDVPPGISSYLPLTGGTMAGNIDMGGFALLDASSVTVGDHVSIDPGSAADAPFLQIGSYTLTADNAVTGDLTLDAGSIGHFRITGTYEVQIVPTVAVNGGIRSGADIEATGKVIADAGLGVGNSAWATTPGTVVKKIEIFDTLGASLGFIAVYDAIS